jgi:hypothetical protein
MIQKTPIYVDFDRRRQLVFNLNTEILIRGAGGRDCALWETVGEHKDEKTGEVSRSLDVNLENLRVYLWAALQDDARAHGETLTVDDVGKLLARRKWITQAVLQMGDALNQYYGDDPKGEA